MVCNAFRGAGRDLVRGIAFGSFSERGLLVELLALLLFLLRDTTPMAMALIAALGLVLLIR